VTNTYFDSIEAFQTAIDPHMDTLLADVPNYTNVEPIVQIGLKEHKICSLRHKILRFKILQGYFLLLFIPGFLFGTEVCKAQHKNAKNKHTQTGP